MKRFRKRRRRKRKTLTSQVFRNKKQIKQLVRQIEHKHRDITEPATTEDRVTAVGHVECLMDGIAQGLTKDDRIGEQIVGKRLFIRGKVVSPTDNAIVRIMVGRFKRPEGSGPPAVSDILFSNSGTLAISLRELDTAANFEILWDHTFYMDVTDNGTALFKFHHKIPNRVVRWQNAGSLNTDIQTNMYFMLYCSDHANDADAPVITFNSRFTYTDG